MPVNTSNCSFGWKAREFKLKSIDEKIYSLQDLKGANGTVIVFICNACRQPANRQRRKSNHGASGPAHAPKAGRLLAGQPLD